MIIKLYSIILGGLKYILYLCIDNERSFSRAGGETPFGVYTPTCFIFFYKEFSPMYEKKFGSVNYYLYLCSIMTKDLSILSPLIILMAISVTVCVYQVSIIIFSDNKKISKWLNDLIK